VLTNDVWLIVLGIVMTGLLILTWLLLSYRPLSFLLIHHAIASLPCSCILTNATTYFSAFHLPAYKLVEHHCDSSGSRVLDGYFGTCQGGNVEKQVGALNRQDVAQKSKSYLQRTLGYVQNVRAWTSLASA
jgi:hypothetical protein